MDNKKERGMEHRERMEMNTMRHDRRRMHLVSVSERCCFTSDHM